MTYLFVKALLSGAIIAAVSELARRSPGLGALIVSLPMVSILSFIWLWRDTGDPARIADLSQGAFWFFLPSIPMFLAFPAMLRAGWNFWIALAFSCLLTATLYAGAAWLAPRIGVRL